MQVFQDESLKKRALNAKKRFFFFAFLSTNMLNQSIFIKFSALVYDRYHYSLPKKIKVILQKKWSPMLKCSFFGFLSNCMPKKQIYIKFYVGVHHRSQFSFQYFYHKPLRNMFDEKVLFFILFWHYESINRHLTKFVREKNIIENLIFKPSQCHITWGGGCRYLYSYFHL